MLNVGGFCPAVPSSERCDDDIGSVLVAAVLALAPSFVLAPAPADSWGAVGRRGRGFRKQVGNAVGIVTSGGPCVLCSIRPYITAMAFPVGTTRRFRWDVAPGTPGEVQHRSPLSSKMEITPGWKKTRCSNNKHARTAGGREAKRAGTKCRCCKKCVWGFC